MLILKENDSITHHHTNFAMEYKKIILLVTTFLYMLSANAQGKFDPKKFTEGLHQYITTEAGLTQQEAARFFPIYEEMKSKQRVLFMQLRSIHRSKPSSEREARGAITRADQIEVDLKALERSYHAKMLKAVSALKLSKVLKAERKFHKQTFRRMAGKR